jgi:hypothetical protein
MRLLVALFLTLSSLNAAPTQRFDLDLISCREFLSTDKRNINYLIVWLRGFWTEADQVMMLDLERVQADAEKVSHYCAENPEVKVFEAAKRLFGH